MASIYEYISSHVVDGSLPQGFELPSLTQAPNEIRWADGALDGVSMYHMGIPEMGEEDRALMEEAVRIAGNGDYNRAEQLFTELGGRMQALFVIDDLQHFIVDNQKALNPNNIFGCARHLITESDNRKCVKFGLSMLELFEMDRREDIKEKVRTLGLSDEFTLFAVFVMSKWQNGNDEIFKLAQKVRGWGRIHAVERLEPETEEIRRWLLTEGCDNDVMSPYSALTCWQKSGAEEILKRGPKREELTGLLKIFDGLVDEGPVAGISQIEDIDGHVNLLLDVAEGKELTIDDYEVYYHIWRMYREDGFEENQVGMRLKKLLLTYDCRWKLIEALKNGWDYDMATDTGVDVKPYALEALRADAVKHAHLCMYTMDEADQRAETLKIFKAALPLEEMKTLPEDSLGLSEDFAQTTALEFLMQELRHWPMEGIEFVETGLQSAPVRTRNGALQVLELWVEAEGNALAEIFPDMWILLTKLRDIEPVDEMKAKMDRLIEGEVRFDEEDSVITD
ncbi:MAG: hypothetical protein IJT40_02315 [Firmicutes bacterium]|nr:hypothetical protein [Bacillota bacterium]